MVGVEGKRQIGFSRKREYVLWKGRQEAVLNGLCLSGELWSELLANEVFSVDRGLLHAVYFEHIVHTSNTSSAQHCADDPNPSILVLVMFLTALGFHIDRMYLLPHIFKLLCHGIRVVVKHIFRYVIEPIRVCTYQPGLSVPSR